MPAVRLLTPRSICIGAGSGVLVAVAFGQIYGVAWGLAVLDGLAAGALVLATSICLRDGRFAGLMETGATVGSTSASFSPALSRRPRFSSRTPLGSSCSTGGTGPRSACCSGAPGLPLAR